MTAARHDARQPGREKNNARLGWILAAIVSLLYIGGLFIQRG